MHSRPQDCGLQAAHRQWPLSISLKETADSRPRGFIPSGKDIYRMFKKKKGGSLKGFTLVEIMIVVAILMILATLAVSSVLRARHNANEMAAVASCRTIVTAAQNFYANSLPHTYPANLQDLSEPNSNPPYIDSVLASGTKQGYNFFYNRVDSETFTLNANPASPGKTGSRYFYSDESGIIRANISGPAGPGDPPVE